MFRIGKISKAKIICIEILKDKILSPKLSIFYLCEGRQLVAQQNHSGKRENCCLHVMLSSTLLGNELSFKSDTK